VTPSDAKKEKSLRNKVSAIQNVSPLSLNKKPKYKI
jgi:hypothetical protein